MLGGHRIDLSGLTAGEARALFMMGAAPGGPEVRSALRKVLAALPPPLREVATAAGQAAHVDPASWGRRPEEPSALEPLRQAVLARVQVDLDYAKPGETARRRRVHPYGLVAKAGVWYLLAGTTDGRRTFRVSRVRAVAPTAEPVVRPDGFDLAGAWDEAQRDFRGRMAVVDVELEVAEAAVLAVTGMLRGWAAATERPAARPGWRRLTASFPHLRAAVANLAPFGDAVRVVAPAELRAELRGLGEALLRAHAQPATGPSATVASTER